MMMQKVPSLIDLCVWKAINNINYLGDVGDTEYHLLERILSHCTIKELTYIENRTKGRDLSPATDKLWRRFYNDEFGVGSCYDTLWKRAYYEINFGEEISNTAFERMRQDIVVFKWRQCYEARKQEMDEFNKKYRQWHKLRHQEAEEAAAKRGARPFHERNSSSKRGATDTKSSTMKKPKPEYVNSFFNNIGALKNVRSDHRLN